jgi:NAD(P)-dependent dehydrogenase (short-subunit alcohol dehydrogenase family)
MSPPLADRTALVTGASRGIGLAVADALHAAGAHVVRLARSLDDRSSARRTDLRCDVSDPAAVDRTLARVRTELGLPDIAVNNAGVFFIKPLETTTPVEFAETLATNLTGPFLIARALIPDLKKRGSGHLVTIGSVADHTALPGSAAYAASKFGLRGMHGVMVLELARSGVRTTLVAPGPVDTNLWDDVDPDARPGFTQRRDMMRAEDVADAVLFAVTRPPRVDVTEIRLVPSSAPPRT